MRYLLALLIVLAVAPCRAAITFGTCWATNQTVGPQTSLSVSVSPVGGTGHVLVAYARSGGGTSIAFSDIHNTWNPAGTFFSLSGVVFSQVGYVQNVTGGTYALTATFSGSEGFAAVGACEISGLLSSGALDVGTESNATSGTGTSVTSPSFNTASSSEIVLGWGSAAAIGTFSVGLIGGITPTLASGTPDVAGLEYAVFSSTHSAITASMNFTPSANFGLTTFALKATASAASVGCDMSQTCN